MTKHQLILILLLLLQTFVINCQISKYNYKDKLEPKSKLVKRGYNYTVEKLKNKTHIFKQYFPETKIITSHVTYKTKKLQIKHGLQIERYDDGEIRIKGEYLNNKKQGIWKEHNWQGAYKNGQQIGKWEKYDDKNRLIQKDNYIDGELHGEQIMYDTLGNIKGESIYELGEMISTTVDTTIVSTYILPQFKGCEDRNGTDKEKKSCTEKKMLGYIYNNIKYPEKARKQGIEGTAIIRFVVGKEGTINNIRVLKGLSKEIKEECYNIIKNMPRWTPGYQNGEAVEIQFNIPIIFRLQ